MVDLGRTTGMSNLEAEASKEVVTETTIFGAKGRF
jgi:hypothetical protein